jgi:hypothetical protein
MDTNERIFEAAFTSLQGLPANTNSFHDIARACVRCAVMWVDLMTQFCGEVTDEQITQMVADLAHQELASLRKEGDRLNFKHPPNSIQ